MKNLFVILLIVVGLFVGCDNPVEPTQQKSFNVEVVFSKGVNTVTPATIKYNGDFLVIINGESVKISVPNETKVVVNYNIENGFHTPTKVKDSIIVISDTTWVLNKDWPFVL